MKARISEALPKLAVGVNVAEDKAAVITGVMAKLGGDYRAADEDCGEDSIGYICGYKGYTRCEQRVGIGEELLIFSGLENAQLNTAVSQLRRHGCIIPLKAMVTPHNKEWTVSALARELASEHEYMSNRGKRDGNG